MLITAGLDLGSGTAKAVIRREDGRILGRAEAKTRADFELLAAQVLEDALRAAGLKREALAYVATTGLGRYAVSFRDIQVTDITAAAKGSWSLAPQAQFVLDVGAQSTRAIRLRDNGKVREFHCNEKCAAGGGAFLVRAAKYLEIPVESMGSRSLEAAQAKAISSVCAVLAESEIINHVSENVPVNDICRGLHESMAERAMALLRKVGLNGPLALIGGVARHEGFVEACRKKFGVEVIVPAEPQDVVATGAALLGLQRAKKRMAEASAG